MGKQPAPLSYQLVISLYGRYYTLIHKIIHVNTCYMLICRETYCFHLYLRVKCISQSPKSYKSTSYILRLNMIQKGVITGVGQEAQWLSGRLLDPRPRCRRFEPFQHHCVVSLSKVHLSLLSSGSIQEDPSWHN